MDRKKIGEFWKRQTKNLKRGISDCLPLGILVAVIFLLMPVWKNWQAESGQSSGESAVSSQTEEKKDAQNENNGRSSSSAVKNESSDQTVEKHDREMLLHLEQKEDGTIRTVALRDYLVGVLLAEVSPDFPEAALEAQAIAARTYCLYRMEKGVSHPSGADICDDYSHCMAYLDLEKAEEESVTVMRAAVDATDGLVLLYDGALIDAVFHDSSPYYTESALAVWGVDLPYLQPVATPEQVPEKTMDFSAAELFEKMGETLPADLPVSTAPFGGVTKDPSGRAESVIVCGTSFSAPALRLALGLPSTSFAVTYADGVYTFHVYGWGHGVGMSQKGAAVFAKGGSTATDILLHYYTGCTIGSYAMTEK